MSGSAGDAGAAIAALRRATRPGEEQRALARLATEPQQRRAMEQFARALERAPDLRAALRDPRVLAVIGTALGIPEAAQQAGLAQRALSANPADPASFLGRLPDRRWRAAAETLQLHRRGLDGLRDPQVQARLAEGLQRAAWRRELEAANPGLGDAVLFGERAARGISSGFEVLGDPVLRRVVTTALGLPQELAFQSVESQLRAVTARLDLGRLSDPKEATRLVERYMIARAREVGGAAGPGGGPIGPGNWLTGLFVNRSA